MAKDSNNFFFRFTNVEVYLGNNAQFHLIRQIRHLKNPITEQKQEYSLRQVDLQLRRKWPRLKIKTN